MVTQEEEPLLKRVEKSLWVWDANQMIKKTITFVPLLYHMFDEMLLSAAGIKGVKDILVNIDVVGNMISVTNSFEDVHLPELPRYFDSPQISTEFTFERNDGKRVSKQVFINQEWSKTYEKSKRRTKSTMLSFKPDLVKLRMGCLERDIVTLMKRRVVDLAGCLGDGVNVRLLGTSNLPQTFAEYVDLYFETRVGFVKHLITRVHEKVSDQWEICIAISEDSHFEHASFVNNIATMMGGTHIDYITRQITDYLAKIVKVTPINIKKHLSVFVNARIDNPSFDSQTKEVLSTLEGNFQSECKLTQTFLRKIGKSHYWRNVKLKVENLADAPLAGTIYSEHCTLLIVEGEAAKDFGVAGSKIMGPDRFGVFPLKGKLLNPKKATYKRVEANLAVQNIKKILGLKDGITYTSKNVKELRYGHLMIMADQDGDGSHIKGLIMNLLHSCWPSLLKLNFVQMFVTPVIKAFNEMTEEVTLFYSMAKYEEMKQNLIGYTIKYYKGLASIGIEEGRSFFGNHDEHIKYLEWKDTTDDDALILAFGNKKRQTEDRKKWLLESLERSLESKDDKCVDIYQQKSIRYCDFIYHEFKEYGVADLKRSIASMIDGLKVSQRKTLYTVFKVVTEMRIETLILKVSKNTDYRHDTECLVPVILGMCEFYAGSNNINLLQPVGHFGSHKDRSGAARYYSTKLSSIASYIFHKDDEVVLQHLHGDGKFIEPIWFMPIIPMVLVNGSEGLAIGCYSFVPNFNPRTIIANLKKLLKGEDPTPMHPWYRGFNGDIEKSAVKDNTYITKGKFVRGENALNVTITELPLNVTKEDYENSFLKSACGKFIKKYEACRDDNGIFEICMTKDQMVKANKEGFLKFLRLTSKISMRHMNLFNRQGRLHKYLTPEEILMDFFESRLESYKKRMTMKRCQIKKDCLELENKVKFITSPKLQEKLRWKSKKDQCTILKDNGYKSSIAMEVDNVGSEDDSRFDYLLTIRVLELQLEDLENLKQERDEKAKQIGDLDKISAESLYEAELDALDEQLPHDVYP